MENRFSVFEKERKMLRIAPQKRIVTYINYSGPLCCLLWSANSNIWVNEHFLSIYCTLPRNAKLWVDYLEELGFTKDVADEEYVNFTEAKKITDVLAYIKSQIEKGNYVTIFFDAFFIECDKHYKKDHYML